MHLEDFFELLSSTSQANSNAAGGGTAGDQSLGGISNTSLSVLGSQLPFARGPALSAAAAAAAAAASRGGSKASAADQGDAKIRASEARLDADVAARRHLEQLLLRLDYNSFFSDSRNAPTDTHGTVLEALEPR